MELLDRSFGSGGMHRWPVGFNCLTSRAWLVVPWCPSMTRASDLTKLTFSGAFGDSRRCAGLLGWCFPLKPCLHPSMDRCLRQLHPESSSTQVHCRAESASSGPAHLARSLDSAALVLDRLGFGGCGAECLAFVLLFCTPVPANETNKLPSFAGEACCYPDSRPSH